MIIILLGPPGAGKGTISTYLIKKNWAQISTGNLFREKLEEDTPSGRELKKIVDSGKLISDEITKEIFLEALTLKMNEGKDIILDGYPRTNRQTQDLRDILLKLKTKIDKVIHLKVDRKILEKRLLNRRVCPTCGSVYNLETLPPKNEGVCNLDGSALILRDDDSTSEKINTRLEVYDKQTSPLVEIYKNEGLLTELNTSNPHEKIISDLIKIIGE